MDAKELGSKDEPQGSWGAMEPESSDELRGSMDGSAYTPVCLGAKVRLGARLASSGATPVCSGARSVRSDATAPKGVKQTSHPNVGQLLPDRLPPKQ